MRAVVQRVARASVSVDGSLVSAIEHGLLVLIGVADTDDETAARWLADKVVGLRIFPDDQGAMNRSVAETGGAVLAVSQFTLLGDARKGRRPSFVHAARPERAEPLVRAFGEQVRSRGVAIADGVFGADMAVELVNDGPVTVLLDSAKLF